MPAVTPRTGTVVILDFGSQVSQLIARRTREANVYSELLPYDAPWTEIVKREPAAIILSGGPESTLGPDALDCAPEVFTSGIPLLGICYGMQIIAKKLGGTLVPLAHAEFGPAMLTVDVADSPIFLGVPLQSRVWMSHGDTVTKPPPGFSVYAHTERAAVAAIGDASRRIFCTTFHPEVVHTEAGTAILQNFLHQVASIEPNWEMTSFVDDAIERIRREVGTANV